MLVHQSNTPLCLENWMKHVAKKRPKPKEFVTKLLQVEVLAQYGLYGYRRIAALLKDAGRLVNDKRVERLWRREGLKLPMKQPNNGRL